jgi:hypothetical protein
MSAMPTFASAYRQLTPAEKAYVDAYVQQVERDSMRAGERVSLALMRPIPAETVEASRGLLTRPMVVAAITERINEIAAANELTAHRVVKEVMNIAFASVGDYMEIGQDGQPWFDLTRCTPEQLAAIKTIKIEENPRGGRKFEFVLHDKLGAIDKLMRYMGMLENDNPHWRAETARPVNTAALPSNVTEDGAADAYARLING